MYSQSYNTIVCLKSSELILVRLLWSDWPERCVSSLDNNASVYSKKPKHNVDIKNILLSHKKCTISANPGYLFIFSICSLSNLIQLGTFISTIISCCNWNLVLISKACIIDASQRLNKINNNTEEEIIQINTCLDNIHALGHLYNFND